jgi:5-methylcytosine-specific restriction endonuclease McrA
MARKRRGRPRVSRFPWRNAPMPEWFYSAPYGRCRWCNKPIYQKGSRKINKRRRWHDECLHDCLIITDPKYLKREVKKRDKGVCAKCKKKCTYRWEWNPDHIKPLVEAKGRIEYWQIDNVQTLCVRCHKKKTIKENVARKKRREKETRKAMKRIFGKSLPDLFND